jgi:GNAT superfamily N-acetyltransferase
MKWQLIQINAREHKDTVLDLHCKINFACETTGVSYSSLEAYRAQWFASPQPEAFWATFVQTLSDSRTFAKMIVDDLNMIIGYAWATFIDVEGYSLRICELNDLYVVPEMRKHGIASEIIQMVEENAKNNGAQLFRSGTGAFNEPSKRMHEKAGFYTYRLEYEKKLGS